MFLKNSRIKKRFCAALAVMLAVTSLSGGVYAKTTHDELDFNLTVMAKRSTITVKPNNTENGSGNNHAVNPDSTSDNTGSTSAFTVTRPIGEEVTINAGSADAAYIDRLSESDTSETNINGFTYTFGPSDETVTVHWKPFQTYFDKADGTGAKEIITTEYNLTNKMPNATRTNYTFQGWYDAQGNKVGGSGTVYTQKENEPTYWAHWSCNHPSGSRTTVNGSWTYHSATQHKQTVTVKCSVCGATMSTSTNYANHYDNNKDGKCDACGSGYTRTITLHWIKPTKDTYAAAYGNHKAAGTSTPQTGTSTYWPVSNDPTPGEWSIKKSGGGTSSRWTFVGWSTTNDNDWDSNGGTTVTSNPREYKTVTAAANAGYTGTLHAVYKRNGTNWYVCAK